MQQGLQLRILAPAASSPVRPRRELMQQIRETAPLPEFLTSVNASTALLSYHISLGKALRAEDFRNGDSVPNALSVTSNSPVKPVIVRQRRRRHDNAGRRRSSPRLMSHPCRPPACSAVFLLLYGGGDETACFRGSPPPCSHLLSQVFRNTTSTRIRGVGSEGTITQADIPTCRGARRRWRRLLCFLAAAAAAATTASTLGARPKK